MMGTTIKMLGLALWFPLLSGALTALATWLIWQYTALHCTPETAAELLCRPTALARYLTPEILQDCIINASIVITLTGGSNLMLFIREHRRANAEQARADRMGDLMERVIIESAARLDRDEERTAQDRERAEARAVQAEERAARSQELAEARAAQAEERAEARAAQAEERAARAEERAIAAHQAFLEALNRMTANNWNGQNRPSTD